MTLNLFRSEGNLWVTKQKQKNSNQFLIKRRSEGCFSLTILHNNCSASNERNAKYRKRDREREWKKREIIGNGRTCVRLSACECVWVRVSACECVCECVCFKQKECVRKRDSLGVRPFCSLIFGWAFSSLSFQLSSFMNWNRAVLRLPDVRLISLWTMMRARLAQRTIAHGVPVRGEKSEEVTSYARRHYCFRAGSKWRWKQDGIVGSMLSYKAEFLWIELNSSCHITCRPHSFGLHWLTNQYEQLRNESQLGKWTCLIFTTDSWIPQMCGPLIRIKNIFNGNISLLTFWISFSQPY